MRRSSRLSDGFTLIEMLIGLMLFALLSVLLFGGFRFGLRAWEAGGAQAERASEIQLVQEMLRRQLAAARPATAAAPEAAAAAGAPFLGTARSLTFVAHLPGRNGAAGLYRFAISDAPDGNDRQLALDWSAFRQDQAPAAAAAETETLLRGIASVSFAYFGHADPTMPPQWQDRWDGSLGLPELVRLSVAFPSGDGRSWPDLFIAPRLRVSGEQNEPASQ